MTNGCDDDRTGPASTAAGSEASDAPASADAATASTVCERLRRFTNDLVGAANDAVTGINERTPPERTGAILAGFDDGLRIAEQYVEEAAQLPIDPDVPERDALLGELRAGAEAAVAELVDERARFATEVPEVTDDDVRGRVGQFFNALEKAMSVTEPAIAAYDRRDLQVAFLDEPACRHVIQQFRLEE
jgi:hypothetical protein